MSSALDIWGAAIATFIQSELLTGHRLVGIGYSSGAVGLYYFPFPWSGRCTNIGARLLSARHLEKYPYLGIILVEPSMMDKETWDANKGEIQMAFDMVTNAVRHRRDLWASKDAAQKYFMARFPWNSWDPRIVALFTVLIPLVVYVPIDFNVPQEHALRDSRDKDGNACVVRKCPMVHEASAFQFNLKHTWDAVDQISRLSRLVPIHVVFGETVDLM
jgi:hypothetical protein